MPGQSDDGIAAVGGLLTMPRVDVPGDAEQPRPGTPAPGIERPQRADRLHERLRGQVGDGLRLGAAPSEVSGDRRDVRAVHGLERRDRLAGPARWRARRGDGRGPVERS